MSLGRPGRETNVEVEEIDGFQFMSFERIDEVHKYLKDSVHSRRQPSAPTQISRGNIKPPKSKACAKTSRKSSSAKSKVGGKAAKGSSTSSASAKPKGSKGKTGSDEKKVPVWLKHKRRLRKGDKRFIVDKFHGFVFVSAFTVDDFDVHEEEIANEVSPGVKRKLGQTAQTQSGTVVSGEKRGKRSTGLDDVPKSGNLVTSSLLFSGTARPAGTNPTKDAGRNASKHAGKCDTIPASLEMSDLDQLVTFTSLIAPPINDALLSTVGQVNEPGQDVAEALLKQIKNRKKQYPHMQIDEAYDGSVSSPSGSESSVITISDDGPDQENIILDVINIDNELSSAQFIQDSIKMANDNQPGEMSKTNNGKAKRKKCRICCIYPSKIVEAKKIGPLFGSFFPSYTVSCVSTCKQHPPGEITMKPSPSKPGYVDTCIQTNAPDIRMNLDFAHRFPHRTIAITTHCTKMLFQPIPRTKRDRFFNKSEHHRTSEQKRREQMHDQFTDLRKIVTTSQAIPDNARASKQWILEQAMMVISSLEAESAVLVALKKTVAAKNERLKSKWRELSGREFNTNTPSELSGQTKLMDLYKQYRKHMQRKNSSKSNEVESNESAVSTQPTSKNRSQAVVENSNEASLARLSSGENTGKQCGGEMVTSKASLDHPLNNEQSHTLSNAMDTPMQLKSKQAVPGNVISQDLSTGNVNHSSRATVTSNPSQVTSLDRPSHDASTITKKTSEVVTFTKPTQISSAASANQTVSVKTSQTITCATNHSSQSTSSGMPNQPCTPIVPVSSQLPIPVTLSSHLRAASNPNPTMRMPSHTVTTSVPPSSRAAVPVMLSSHPRAVRIPSNTMTTSVPPSSLSAIPGKAASHHVAVNLNPTIVRMPTGAIALRMPNSTMNMATQFLAVSQPSQPTGQRLLIPLSKLNQALFTRKPTQWTAMSKLNQEEVNKLHVEDVGAVVEVGAGQLDDKVSHQNDTVLLDVAQTEYKSAPGEQGRTLSLIPTSSSINVTLKSVGSITSNKIFNKKPVPSKQKPLVGLQVDQTNNKPVFIVSKQKTETNLTTGPTPRPMFGQVPQISETLLAETFQDGKNIESTNETGLCIISNVFSLSDVEPEVTTRDVDVNCNSTTHDHNYFKCETNMVADNNTE